MITNEYIHEIKLAIVLILQIPAILLSLVLFTFFILHHVHLRKLQNQAMLILLIVNFSQLTLNIPLFANFLRLHRVSPATGAYCRWWLFIEFTLDTENVFLVAVISLQRHALIFHSHAMRIRFNRYVYYYTPLALAIIYPIVFYSTAVLFYPCDEQQWNFALNTCGDTTCYLSNNQPLATYDWVVNTGVPIGVLVLANVALIGRVMRQKCCGRLAGQQNVSWTKQRRMTLQLLSISCLYLFTWTPTVVVGIMQQINRSDHLYTIKEVYLSDLTYLICMLVPWLSIGLIPDFSRWIFRSCQRQNQRSNVIRPAE